MPRVINSKAPTKGPGSSVGCRKKRIRRHNNGSCNEQSGTHSSLTAETTQNNAGFIGQELLQWDEHSKHTLKSSKDEASKETITEKVPVVDASKTAMILPQQTSAIIFDTRFPKCDPDVGTEIIEDFANLLGLLSARGIKPDLVASTKLSAEGKTVVSPLNHAGMTSILIGDGSKEGADFSAQSSWDLFVGMAGDVVRNASQNPLTLTVVTTDVAFFLQDGRKAHMEAFEVFWKSLATLFSTSPLSQFRLVVIKTDVTLQRENNESHSHETESILFDLQTKMEDIEGCSPPGDFLFHIVSGGILGYRALVREILRERLSQVSHCGINFDLPESADGTQCNLALIGTFKTFPYQANSILVSAFRKQLIDLSKHPMKVLQLVPLSSVDASLLFGLPLSLRPGIQESIEEFQEMDVLARVLFRLLHERELALVLQTRPGDSTSREDHLYLLMAEEFPNSSDHSPQSGLLIRYASANQLLSEAAPVRPSPLPERENEYTTYVESALGQLDCEPLNPLELENRSADVITSFSIEKPPSTSDQMPNNSETWNDIHTIAKKECTEQASGEIGSKNFSSDDAVWNNDAVGVGLRAKGLDDDSDGLTDTDDGMSVG